MGLGTGKSILIYYTLLSGQLFLNLKHWCPQIWGLRGGSCKIGTEGFEPLALRKQR